MTLHQTRLYTMVDAFLETHCLEPRVKLATRSLRVRGTHVTSLVETEQSMLVEDCG